MVLCCGSRTKIAEQLAGSSHSFLCADFCQQPILYLIGLGTALVQSFLLLLVWARAEANMFFELYSHNMVNKTSLELDLDMMFPDKSTWEQLGKTGPDPEDLAAASLAGGASFAPPPNSTEGLERYNLMVRWSEMVHWMPTQITHPDLQLDYALVFALMMILLWTAKDAVTAVLCLFSGRLVVSSVLALNVVLAIMTGWAQMYIKFLPIFVWDVPANVIGVSCAQAAHGPSNARAAGYPLMTCAHPRRGAPHLSRSRAGRSR